MGLGSDRAAQNIRGAGAPDESVPALPGYLKGGLGELGPGFPVAGEVLGAAEGGEAFGIKMNPHRSQPLLPEAFFGNVEDVHPVLVARLEALWIGGEGLDGGPVGFGGVVDEDNGGR